MQTQADMMIPPAQSPKIAVVIPCYQEALTIGKVVADFRRVLPDAQIFVYDNNSTDDTARIARAAGAVVRREKRQGKGFVVASMFDQVDADILVMVDGDDTYEAEGAPRLLEPILAGDADITVGTRLHAYGDKSFPRFHLLGNRMVSGIINWMFNAQVSDIFSGYRAFSRAAAAQIPITARGFDVETELTLQALYRGLVIKEIALPYRARPAGSYSKLRTVSDGSLVLLKLFLILKSYKPLTLFGLGSILLFLIGLAVGSRCLYLIQTQGQVQALGSAIVSGFMFVLSALSFGYGLIINSVNIRLLELEKLICRPSARRDGQTSG